jgi:hypothetical protein
LSHEIISAILLLLAIFHMEFNSFRLFLYDFMDVSYLE